MPVPSVTGSWMPFMTHSLWKYSNILLIKPGAIGDLILITPVIRALHEAYPDTSISLMVSDEVSASLFAFHPLVRKTIVYDRKGAHRSPAAFFGLWRELRQDGYDLVINFQRSNLKAWFLVTAAFPARVLVYHKARNRVVHAVLNHLETLAPLGIDPARAGTAPEMHVGPEADAHADDLFRSSGLSGHQVIALNPGASHPVNRWSAENFALLADRLMAGLGVRVVVVGGREDIPLADEIAAKAQEPIVNLAGEMTLLQLGAVLKRCAILISGDTGPMHMATAVGTPVVALFGAADPARTGPVGEGHRIIQAEGIDCVPCRSRRCSSSRYLECMERISVDEVYQACALKLPDYEG